MVNVYFLRNRSFIKITGSDSGKVLHGLLTQNILAIPVNSLAYACMLSPKGKFILDCFVIKTADNSFGIDIASCFVDRLLLKLKQHSLISEFEFKLIDNTNIFAVIPFDGVALSQITFQDGISPFLDTRLNLLGYRVYLTTESCSNLTNGLVHFGHFSRITSSNSESLEIYIPYLINEHLFDNSNTSEKLLYEDEYQDVLIVSGIIDGCFIPQDRSLPLLYGMKEQNAISIDKGCYLGQESVMMNYTSGSINKSIFRASMTGSRDNVIDIVVDKNFVNALDISKLKCLDGNTFNVKVGDSVYSSDDTVGKVISIANHCPNILVQIESSFSSGDSLFIRHI